jgi:hypothetical protein
MELLLGVPEDDPGRRHAVDRGRRHVQESIVRGDR